MSLVRKSRRLRKQHDIPRVSGSDKDMTLGISTQNKISNDEALLQKTLSSKWAKRRNLVSDSHLSASRIRYLEDLFKSIDIDGSGTISFREFSDPLFLSDAVKTNLELFDKLKKFDKDGSRDFSFNEFVHILENSSKQDSCNIRKEIDGFLQANLEKNPEVGSPLVFSQERRKFLLKFLSEDIKKESKLVASRKNIGREVRKEMHEKSEKFAALKKFVEKL